MTTPRLTYSHPRRRLRDGDNFVVVMQREPTALGKRILAILLRHELRGKWPA
jgi:hypothetical protein